jgi:hemolysin activation/secretion protein
MVGRWTSTFACFVILIATTASALAQVPSTAEPGRIEQRFKTSPSPQSAPEITIPGPEAPMPSAEAAKIHFQLSGVVIEGATVFHDADFVPLYQPLIGKDVTLAQVFALRDGVTAKYRQAGYVLSQAIIPPQKISGGVIHIRVIEGFIWRVEIQGNARDARGLIQNMADKIVESRPLNVRVLERQVLLISDLPGIHVKTIIKPSEAIPGAATLMVIIDRDVFAGSAQIDNRGSRAIGPLEAQIGINLNSIFGLDEQTSLMLATTGQPKQLQYGQLTSSWVLDPNGLRFSASGSFSDSKPSGSIAPLNAIGHTLTIHSGLDYPIIRSRSENLHITAEFTYLNSRTDLLGTLFSNDHLRYLTISANYDVSDTWLGDTRPGSTILSLELASGFKILDATQLGSITASRANGRSDFTRLYVEATRIQSLYDNWSLALSLSAQKADVPLLSSVQFGLGGSRFGRGYEPSELTGDDGVAGSIEARYDLSWDFGPLSGPQFYAFYDVGGIWNINPSLGTPLQESLASAGLGIRLTLFDRISAGFELAKPLTRAVASRGDKDIRPLFNISTKF